MRLRSIIIRPLHPVLILGARSFASEVADIISDIPDLELKGFVENLDPARCAQRLEGLQVFWVDELAALAATHRGVCALGSTHRRRFIEQAVALGLEFVTLVHPSARVSSRSTLAEGTIVCPGAQVASNAQVGRHVLINRGALVGHNVRIGDYVTVGPGANVAGFCEVRSGAYIGIGATLVEQIVVGSSAVVAAGAVVTRDVAERTLVAGAPARLVKSDVDGL